MCSNPGHLLQSGCSRVLRHLPGVELSHLARAQSAVIYDHLIYPSIEISRRPEDVAPNFKSVSTAAVIRSRSKRPRCSLDAVHVDEHVDSVTHPGNVVPLVGPIRIRIEE